MVRPCQHEKLARGAQDKEHAMSQKLNAAIAVIGIDIGKNSFHIVGENQHGAMGPVRQSAAVSDRHGGPASARIASVAR
jgi:hypothetical protein